MHGLCKWCQEQRAYNTRDPTATYASTGPILSRDEFGQDLFAAIKAQAGSIQAYKTAGLFQSKGLTLEAEQAAQAAKVCQHELETILKRETLAVEDLRRILAMQ